VGAAGPAERVRVAPVDAEIEHLRDQRRLETDVDRLHRVREVGNPGEGEEIKRGSTADRAAAGPHLLEQLLIRVADREGDPLEGGPGQVDPRGPSVLLLEAEPRA